MYAGGEVDLAAPIDVPEWKRLLIMRKRAGGSHPPDQQALSNGAASRHGGKLARPPKPLDNGLHFEATPPRTVTRTIGNINVELRSVSGSVDSPDLSFSTDGSSPGAFGESTSVARDPEDLQYGPGIVDRLRARFLNMGADQRSRKPVVRRFSSLENLPGSHASGPFRLRGVRQNGRSSVFGHHQGHVKKAQSMETLLSSTPEQPVLVRRAGHVRGLKGRTTAGRNGSWISDENDEPDGRVSPHPEVPKRSWDYTRSVSASSIREDELPKPDTVKQVKRMFESPGAAERSGPAATGMRFRSGHVSAKAVACNGTSPDPVAKAACNGAMAGGGPPRHSQLTKVQGETTDIEEVSEEDSETAKLTSAKEEEDSVDSDLASDGTEYDPPADDVAEPPSYHLVDEEEMPDDLSPANGARETLIAEADDNARFKREESEESFIVVCEAAKVTPERLPSAERSTPEQQEVEVVSFQPREELSREGDGAEEEQPTLVADISPDDFGGERAMVVASSAVAFQKPWAVKKPPPSTTSVVFDFRGKDVKPNISLNPTPFGCRPAKVSRRAGSPPDGSAPRVNGDATRDDLEDDEDDWDEMDIGADLPAVCGIEFDGENVKVGRGALLETRDKRLTIQFDDGATSTFEYPSEQDSPSDENGLTSPPAISMDSPANARLGLSNYTPHVLSSDEDFELGVSRPSQRPMKPLPKVPTEEEVTTPEDIVPAEEAAGWSSAETTDILF